MFGIEISEIFLFLRQAGLALVGAASLWGFVFLRWSKHRTERQTCVVYEWLGAKLLLPLVAGFGTVLASLLFLSLFAPVSAHEGIVLATDQGRFVQIGDALPFVFVWILVFAGGFLLKVLRPKLFQEHLEWFYAANFAAVAFFFLLFAWQGSIDRAQLFFWGHSIHSVFTLGTVLVLDFLFLLSKSSVILKQHVYPLFPTISKVIWLGLGIDFLSSALAFQEAIALTPKFFFMQTVVGILIVNGALLAGPITRKMMDSVKEGRGQITTKWERIADISGVVSISSWGTITLVDSFAHLSLGYFELVSAYVGLIFLLFLGHLTWEALTSDTTPELAT